MELTKHSINSIIFYLNSTFNNVVTKQLHGNSQIILSTENGLKVVVRSVEIKSVTALKLMVYYCLTH